jgi:hypothetical protein
VSQASNHDDWLDLCAIAKDEQIAAASANDRALGTSRRELRRPSSRQHLSAPAPASPKVENATICQSLDGQTLALDVE